MEPLHIGSMIVGLAGIVLCLVGFAASRCRGLRGHDWDVWRPTQSGKYMQRRCKQCGWVEVIDCIVFKEVD